jgi:hypothetical protein
MFRVLLMDLETSPRCEKDRLVIEDGRTAFQSGPVTQVTQTIPPINRESFLTRL